MAVSANRLELLQIADAVAREKAIDRMIVVAAMEDAIQKAARQRYGSETDVRLSLTGLRPGGVYSVFYGTLGPDSENPLCPGVERTLALPAVKPDASALDTSSFTADASGAADFHGSLEGHLLDASQVFFSIVYHSDGLTYGPLPNAGESSTQGANCRSSFGEDAMRQLLVLQKW